MSYKYIVITNLENKLYNNRLPLHVTLMPWFEGEEEQIDIFLNQLSRQIKPFDIHLDNEDMFGANFDIKVNLVNENDKFINIHKQILEFINSNNYKLINDNYVGEKYTPHVTKIKRQPTDKGQLFKINNLELFKTQDIFSNQRRLVKRYDLNERT